VSLAPASGQTVTVPYATVDGTAVAPKDYQATTGVVTLAPGQTSVTVPVIVEADRFAEPTRSFSVALGAATGATVGRGSGIVTITNTGPAMPTMNISDVTVGEAWRQRRVHRDPFRPDDLPQLSVVDHRRRDGHRGDGLRGRFGNGDVHSRAKRWRR